mmetsp:Transcript_19746/g.75708  ORF Transcript_19746/g.75708 Transcript_19746/m.75708 type:complete len:290 (+) Transcript_19746:1008-1877(+)
MQKSIESRSLAAIWKCLASTAMLWERTPLPLVSNVYCTGSSSMKSSKSPLRYFATAPVARGYALTLCFATRRSSGRSGRNVPTTRERQSLSEKSTSSPASVTPLLMASSEAAANGATAPPHAVSPLRGDTLPILFVSLAATGGSHGTSLERSLRTGACISPACASFVILPSAKKTKSNLPLPTSSSNTVASVGAGIVQRPCVSKSPWANSLTSMQSCSGIPVTVKSSTALPPANFLGGALLRSTSCSPWNTNTHTRICAMSPSPIASAPMLSTQVGWQGIRRTPPGTKS